MRKPVPSVRSHVLFLAAFLPLGCPAPTSPSQNKHTLPPVAPTLTVTPENGATKVPVTLASVVLIASEPLDATTVTGTNITLSEQSGAGVSTTPTLSSDGLRITLPLQGLQENDSYSLYVAGLKAAAASGGLPLAMPFQSQFSTGSAPPGIVQTTPQTGAAGVPVTEELALTFSQAVQDTTPSAIQLFLGATATPVPATVTFDPSSTVAFLMPTAALLEGTMYSVKVGAGLTNVSDGLPLANAPVTAMSFTTAIIAPTVVSVSPMNLAEGLMNPVVCTLTFSGPLASPTVNTTNILLTDLAQNSSGATAIDVSLAGAVVTIIPSAPLTPGDTYALVATTGVTDTHGVALTEQFSSQFSLALLPLVTGIAPASATSGVGLLQELEVTFNEPVMNVDNTTFTVTPTGSNALVPGSVSVNGAAASFSPTPPGYAVSTAYTVTLSAGITDANGYTLTPFTATFMTGTM